MAITISAPHITHAQAYDSESPLGILSEAAPSVVPVLYELAARSWPLTTEVERRRFGFFGPTQREKLVMPPRFKILLRRYDLATLNPSWRLEASGPIECFEWDDSGKIMGSYGFRYPVISVVPVYDERNHPVGFAVNGRPSNRPDGALGAIDARIDTAAFIRSTNVDELLPVLRSPDLRPRIEEARPGVAPTWAYVEVLKQLDKGAYISSKGANEYVSPGWTPQTLRSAFDHPAVRSVWVADPSGPSATPKPEHH